MKSHIPLRTTFETTSKVMHMTQSGKHIFRVNSGRCLPQNLYELTWTHINGNQKMWPYKVYSTVVKLMYRS